MNSPIAMAGIAWGHNYSWIKIFHNHLLSALFFKEEKGTFPQKI